jgi:hypothetical protein
VSVQFNSGGTLSSTVDTVGTPNTGGVSSTSWVSCMTSDQLTYTCGTTGFTNAVGGSVPTAGVPISDVTSVQVLAN